MAAKMNVRMVPKTKHLRVAMAAVTLGLASPALTALAGTTSGASKIVTSSFARSGVFSGSEPRANEFFTVAARIASGDTGKLLQAGSIDCRAQIGRRLQLAPVWKGFREGFTLCVWDLPRKARRKVMRGSISFRAGDAAPLEQSFTLKIKR